MPPAEPPESSLIPATRDFPSSVVFIPAGSVNPGFVNLLGLPLHQLDRGQTALVGGKQLNPPRVLLADDHQAMLDTEIALLSPTFDVVGTAADGEALLSEARRLHPDVIVTDISMPILNGIDAMRKLREIGFHSKVCVRDGTLGRRVRRGMHGGGSFGVRAQVLLESRLGACDKSGACRPAVTVVICFFTRAQRRSDVAQLGKRPPAVANL